MPHIDAILFDLGNVLIRWDPRLHYRDRFETADAMEAWLAEVAPTSWNHEMDLGKPFAQAIAERTVLYPEHAVLLAEWRSHWERMLGGAIDGSVQLLADLRREGYRVAALSNWSAETYPRAQARFAFLGWFEHVVLSGVEGVAKPDPVAYELALARTGFEAARTVFIDDNQANVDAARAVGLHALRFTSPEQCRDDLRHLGVRV